MPRRKGNILAVISSAAAAKLRRLAIFPDIYCHHITIAAHPDDVTYRKYARLLGRRVRFQVTGVYADSKGQAARVTGVPSENAHPHITISCAPGVHPKYSNDLLAKKRLPGKRYRQRGWATVTLTRP